MGSDTDPLVSKPVPRGGADPWLRNGNQYRESLRDGRVVIVNGRDVPDVTQEPGLKRGIDTLAGLFDAQFDPLYRDITTAIEPDSGQRIATGWLVPRTIEDLKRRGRMIKYSTQATFGVFGRPPDYGTVNPIGFLAFAHLIAQEHSEARAKIEHCVRVGQQNNLVSTDIIVDVQANRKLSGAELPGRLRVVEQRKDGVVLYGAKAGNSILAQGNMGSLATILNPTLPDDCAILAALPANAPGLKLLTREFVTAADQDPEDHPLDSRGEEADGMLLFDHVFVPDEYVFSVRNRKVLEYYHLIGQLAFWNIATRLSYRAEIFAGAVQLVVNVLGTDHIPQVRAAVTEVIAYAATLRAFMVAAEEKAKPTETGVMLPDHALVTAGRLHSIVELPRVMQVMRELSGQGLVSRVPRKTWERADIGPMLDTFLPGFQTSGRDKNRLFNLIWDMTCSAHGMRVAIFENVNATPASTLREELYKVYDRSEGIAVVKRMAGMA
ncbi:MAG: 4-hydroxyphenylacetate 3-monooxygenase [Alphaproteobacteria bacterium]|nr:4-hydroxyphenylacetate 3-monooxygenase [Alphaproteobacteria bacterium]